MKNEKKDFGSKKAFFKIVCGLRLSKFRETILSNAFSNSYSSLFLIKEIKTVFSPAFLKDLANLNCQRLGFS